MKNHRVTYAYRRSNLGNIPLKTSLFSLSLFLLFLSSRTSGLCNSKHTPAFPCDVSVKHLSQRICITCFLFARGTYAHTYLQDSGARLLFTEAALVGTEQTFSTPMYCAWCVCKVSSILFKYSLKEPRRGDSTMMLHPNGKYNPNKRQVSERVSRFAR